MGETIGLRPSRTLRFHSAVDETNFVQRLQPQVACWATVYFCVSAIVQTAGFAWILLVQVRDARRPFVWAPADPRTFGLLVLGGVLAAQIAISLLMLLARRSRLSRLLPWEAVSVGSVALLCVVYPWANPWHSSVLLGARPADAATHWGRSVHEAEGAAIACVTAMAAGFCALVPIRTAMWPVIPFGALGSYCVLLATLGPTDGGMVPVRLSLLALLFLLPMGNIRKLETQERQRYLMELNGAEHVVSGEMWRPTEGVDSYRLRRRSSQACDITFHLSSTFALTKTSCAVHASFFGRWAEGLSFTSFLPPQDRARFETLIPDISGTGRVGSLQCTLNLPQGPVRVDLTAMDVDSCDDSSDAKFIIGLDILDEAHWRPIAGRNCSDVEDPRWAGVLSVPEDLPLNAAPPIRRASVPTPAQTGRKVQHRLSAPLPGHCVGPLRLTGDGSGSSGQPSSKSDSSGGSRFSQVVPADVPGVVAHGVPPLPPTMQLAPSDDSGLSAQTSEDSVFWYSESTIAARRSSQDSRREVRKPTAATAAQTEAPPCVETAVNTDIVMDEFGFRCAACSKPPVPPVIKSKSEGCAPVVPGPMALALIAKLDRKKGVSRSTASSTSSEGGARGSPTHYYFRGPEFNGCWVAERSDGSGDINSWLRHFAILNGHAVLGDDSEVPLLRVGTSGPVLLCGGHVQLLDDGRLVRRGKSGATVVFSRAAAANSEAPSEEEVDTDRVSFAAKCPSQSSA